ncbi:MAG: radical SAM protein, partial [Cyanobacteria bacterium J06635_11]
WVALKLLWNPGKLGEFFGDVCLEAMRTNPNDFGREVMAILERRLGKAPLAEALSAPVRPPVRALAEVSS